MKYLIHEGFVESKDGDTHFINGETLIRLYKLNKNECHIIRYNNPSSKLGLDYSKNYKHLFPKSNGDYVIKEK